MIFDKIKKAIFGYDIFISYARRDGLDYAYAVATILMKNGYQCYIDQLSSISPGKELPSNIRHAVKNSTALVIIGSEGACESKSIMEEVKLFLDANRNKPIIPITIEGAVNQSIWFANVEGLALVKDIKENLQSGRPATDVIDRIKNALTFTRKSARLRYISLVIALATTVIGGFAIFSAWKAADAVVAQKDAQLKEKQAEELALAANKKTSEALLLQSRADSGRNRALEEKSQAEIFTKIARSEAHRFQTRARSNLVAINALSVLDSDPTLSYNLARSAYIAEPTNISTYNPLVQSIHKAPFYAKKIYAKNVDDIEFSPNGKTIALLKYDEIVFHDLTTDEERVQKVKGLPDGPIVFAPDGKYLVGNGSKAIIYDTDGKQLGRIIDSTRNRLDFSGIFFDNKGASVITVAEDFEDNKKETRKTWNLDGSAAATNDTLELYRPNPKVSGVIMLSTKDNVILLTDTVAAGDFVNGSSYVPVSLRGHLGNNIKQVIFSPDGKSVASLGDDNYLIVWNTLVHKDKQIGEFKDIAVHAETSTLLAFDHEKVEIHNIASGEVRRYSDQRGIQGAGFLDRGIPYLVKGKEIRILQNGKWGSFTFSDKVDKVFPLKDGTALVTGEKSLWVLNLREKSIRVCFQSREIDKMNISPTGKHVVVVHNKDSASLYDMTGRCLSHHLDHLKEVTFTPDGQKVVVTRGYGAKVDTTDGIKITLDTLGEVNVHSLTGKLIWRYHDKEPLNIIFNGGSRFAMTSKITGEHIYWDILTNRKLFKKQRGMQGLASKFTSDGKYYLSASPPSLDEGLQDMMSSLVLMLLGLAPDIPVVPQLWDLQTGQAFSFKGDSATITDAKFSPDQKFIVTYDQDKNVTIWNMFTRKPLELTGHYKKVKMIDFSTDKKWILTYSEDQTVRLWDYGGNEVFTFDNVVDEVSDMGFINGSNYIYIKKANSNGFGGWSLVKNDDENKSDKTENRNEEEAEDTGNNNCYVLLKPINPELIVKQIDQDKLLGDVWEMTNELKIKYNVSVKGVNK